MPSDHDDALSDDSDSDQDEAADPPMKRQCTAKNGALRYTLIGVVGEVLFQHPCLAPIFSRIIVVGCMIT